MLVSYGCTACHQVPGVRLRAGNAGPPLHHLRKRAYIAGRLPNTPGNLMRWIVEPTSVDSQTVMPDTGVSVADARDIAAYLYGRDR